MTRVKRLNYWPSGLVIMNREKLVSRQGTNAEGKGNSWEENGALSNNNLTKRFSRIGVLKSLKTDFLPLLIRTITGCSRLK